MQTIQIEQDSIITDITVNHTQDVETKNILFDYNEDLLKDGQKIKIDNSNAYMFFKKIHIICPVSPVEKYYLNENVSIEENSNIKNNMIVHTLDSLSILTSKFFMNNIKILNENQISKFRNIGQPFSEHNLVVIILTINYFNLKNFLDMFIKNKSIEDLHKIIIMSNYFKLNKNHLKVKTELYKLMNNLDGSNFWSYTFNTNYNYDYLIKHRVIEEFKKPNTNVNTYENLIIPLNKKFMLANLERNGKKIFKLTQKVNFSKENSFELFKYFMNDNKLTSLTKAMVNNFLQNPKLCHLIVNNLPILKKMKTEYLKTEEFKKNLAYTWIRLYNDELIKSTNIKTTDDIVFEIDTAAELPSYPNESYNLKSNPYFPLLISNKVLNSKKNILGLQVNKDLKIANFNEFQRQMNIFITGKPYINIFENIDLVSKNISICGSIIPACSIINHPNLAKFDNDLLPHNDDEERMDALLRRFFAEYYSKSDIDIMISNSSHFEFCKKANELFNELLLNFCRYFRYAEPELFKLEEIKSIGLFLTEEFLVDSGFTEKDIIQFKFFIDENDNDNIYNMIKDHIEDIYNKIVLDEYNELSKDNNNYCDNFMSQFKYNMSELKENNIKVVFNTKIVDKIFNSNKKIKIYINTKYYISSPFINHDIEIFRNKEEDAFSLVSKFHLNCVRGYYNGKTVYMLPSCITALKLLLNIDLIYFAGKWSPYEIINKYRMRGIGTILNKRELGQFKIYITKTKWKKLYKICSNDNCNSCDSIGGFLRYNASIFQPRNLLKEEFYTDKIQILDLKYNKLIDKKPNIDSSNLIITTNGNILRI